jgi:ribose/xylose/arabinose/galactoside ABC-type transport system permease subunit
MTTESVTAPPAMEAVPRTYDGRLRRLARFVGRYGIVLALLGLSAVSAVASPYFLTMTNLFNVALQASVICIVAVGMTFVITLAGIDLSVGSIVGVAGMVTADILVHGWGILPAVVGGMAVGTACGAFNGLMITRVRLPPFIVTLGTMSAYRGLALIYNQGRPIYGLAREDVQVIAGYAGPVPIPVIIAAVVAIVAWFVLNETQIGRYTTAIGGNEEVARLAGINVNRYKVVVYSLCGLLSGLAAVILTTRLYAAEPIAGVLYELEAIAATVMGGTNLMGGQGTIVGTVAGALLISVLRNLFNLRNIQAYYQQLAIGIVIMLAVVVDQLRKR